MSTEIHSLLIKTYVNCVKFLNDKHLLASAGNTIQVYNVTTAELLGKRAIFTSQRIHGILVNNNQVLLFGGFQLTLVDITVSKNVSINVIHEWRTEQWVQDASFLLHNKYGVLGSSNVLYFYKRENGDLLLERQFQCKERSVLYSGKILGTNWFNVVVLCGTVFSQITLWSPTLNDCNIVHRLIGHQGVIFSVTYHEGNKTIVSTSDDRSLRIWKVEMETSDNTVENWKHAKITLVSSIFGHTARVWRNLQLNNGKIISIGEDGQLKIWCGDTCVHSWNSHQNGNVWSMDYNETSQLIVTGGGDAGIYLWPLSHEGNRNEPLQVEAKLATDDFPRQVLIARKKKLLIYTNDGIILSHGPHDSKQVLKDARFRSFCILSISKSKEYYSTASISGDILIFYEATDEIVCEYKVGREKIFSFHWLDKKYFVVCKNEGLLTLFKLVPESKCILEVNNFVLPPCKERWLTAAILTDSLFICGDREGSVHVYNSETQCHMKTYHKIHSRLGVSCIEYDSHSKTLMSIGRDGFLRHWEIKKSNSSDNDVGTNVRMSDQSSNNCYTNRRCFKNYDNLEIEHSSSSNGSNVDSLNTTVSKSDFESSENSNFLVSNNHNSIMNCTASLYHVVADKLPLDWPAHIHTSSDGDIYIIGFHEVHLVIWSTREQKIIFKLKCGGGHRSWDYCLQGSYLYFSFIKQKRVYHVAVDLFQLTRPAIVQSFHRDEINALVCVKMKEEQLLISGGEDNTLRISSLYHGPSSHMTAVNTGRTNSHFPHTAISQKDIVSTTRETEQSMKTLKSASQSTETTSFSLYSHTLHTHLILRSHISSIRSLDYVHIGEDVYIASGGGRAQLKIWKLRSSTKNKQETSLIENHSLGSIDTKYLSLIQNDNSNSIENHNSCLIQNQSLGPIGNHSRQSPSNSQSATPITVQYQCKELFSHMLNGEDRKEKSWKLVKPRINPETRYMDIALHSHAGILYIATACSDGFIRVFRYHIETNRFSSLQDLAHHGKCVLKVHIVNFGARLILCSLSTNGNLAMWDFRQLMSEANTNVVKNSVDKISNYEANVKPNSATSIPQNIEIDSSQNYTAEPTFHIKNTVEQPNLNPTLSPLAIYTLHQGGINSFDSRPMGTHLMLISGGDDCSLVLTILSTELKVTRQLRTPRAHDSQITGVKFLNDDRIVSSSIDQRIVVWTWRGEQLIRLDQLDSCIPDVHGLDVISGDRVCVFGCGVHVAQVVVEQ